jgi:hypothetical protein
MVKGDISQLADIIVTDEKTIEEAVAAAKYFLF